MSRLLQIANASGLDPRNARAVSGVTTELADQIIGRLVAGDSDEAVVVAVGTPVIVDGYRKRQLSPGDVAIARTWLDEARRRLRWQNRDLDAKAARHDELLRALGSEIADV